ncbi:low molecular weight protein-tyrosine-phosphatase [Anaeromyxobacter oryzae]|uniref:protein-tyrosine-phosphatase n=1 Tax=Anaeromyxobacter oryzae TaxID=2918170 RepID=A0ABM7WS34_9BACT|nr:low molecular weight protein-tyrosine-phosphatase [Anaeromyxobacter oryzae]BDG02299.1 protein-tyrosine-phosphatase [Anaeromyxobacter oryzae]
MFSRILIVCVGNVCRSPMAEVLLAERLARRRAGATVESAGLRALVGHPAERIAQDLMRERGLDLSRHVARQLTADLGDAFELILVMERAHERAVQAIAPNTRGRIRRLGHFGDFDVPDPFQQERPAFERSLALIERGLEGLEKAFWSARP